MAQLPLNWDFGREHKPHSPAPKDKHLSTGESDEELPAHLEVHKKHALPASVAASPVPSTMPASLLDQACELLTRHQSALCYLEGFLAQPPYRVSSDRHHHTYLINYRIQPDCTSLFPPHLTTEESKR